jgi:SAM-dependent methyltransferase
VDLSGALLGIARERLGPDVPLHQADLSQPLAFPDNAFDLVLSSLVMHYLAEREPTLREVHRVLPSRGRLVLSTHHPLMDMRISGSDDYFGTYAFTEDWERDGQTMSMRSGTVRRGPCCRRSPPPDSPSTTSPNRIRSRRWLRLPRIPTTISPAMPSSCSSH